MDLSNIPPQIARPNFDEKISWRNEMIEESLALDVEDGGDNQG